MFPYIKESSKCCAFASICRKVCRSVTQKYMPFYQEKTILPSVLIWSKQPFSTVKAGQPKRLCVRMKERGSTKGPFLQPHPWVLHIIMKSELAWFLFWAVSENENHTALGTWWQLENPQPTEEIYWFLGTMSVPNLFYMHKSYMLLSIVFVVFTFKIW